MSRTAKLLTLVAFAISATPAIAADKPAEKAPAAKTAAKNVESTPKELKPGEKDENVKAPVAEKNNRNNVPPPPPEKDPAHKGRGSGPGSCRVVVNNYTGLYINVYIDGNPVGQVGRYNEGTMYVGSGRTVFYARAEFDDGSFDTWGPQVLSCYPGGQMTWGLRR